MKPEAVQAEIAAFLKDMDEVLTAAGERSRARADADEEDAAEDAYEMMILQAATCEAVAAWMLAKILEDWSGSARAYVMRDYGVLLKQATEALQKAAAVQE